MLINNNYVYVGVFIVAFLSQITGCGGGDSFTGQNEHDVVTMEAKLITEWQAHTVSVQGSVVDKAGDPIADAVVAIDDETKSTGVEGVFEFVGLPLKAVSLQVSHDSYRSEQLMLNMQLPLATNTLNLAPIILENNIDNQVRFLFGGDVAFGRRYIDPDETTSRDQMPVDNSDALIQVSDPAPGTRDVLQWIKPLFESADWGVVNLESPVTANPSTPHSEKSFAFFTLPGSLEGLTWAGIDYVSLGNNHVYDYLELGLSETLANLDNTGIKHSGAGASSTTAFAAYRESINGYNYAFISATSVAGDEHTDNYVADDVKGGAADLRQDDAVTAALSTEQDAGFIPIMQLHTGKEYTFTPSAYAAGRMSLAANNGAALVVAHHPHVAQGVAYENGVYMLDGLGNLAFDQSRLETMLGLLAQVDMIAEKVDTLRLLPVYIKNYVPIPVGGDLANRFLRRIGEYSTARGTTVYPYHGQGVVAINATEFQSNVESTSITVSLSESGLAIVDLRAHADSVASLSMINTVDDVSMTIGRDIMLYGDFEDWDSDDQLLEAARWDVSGDSRFVCLSHAMRGTAGLCSVRDSGNSSDSVTPFRNRIRVEGDALDTPNKDLSLFGYIKGENAGPVSIVSRYYASAGALTFGEELAYQHAGGSYDWTAFSAVLNMPADENVDDELSLGEVNARATRIFIHQSPPVTGEAMAAFDELAIINWEEEIVVGNQLTIPHARDFVRIQGSAGAQVELTLSFTSYSPVN